MVIHHAAAVLPSYTPALNPTTGGSRATLIRAYFNQQYTYKEIVASLANLHSIILTVRHLKRILKKMGLRRKVPHDNNLLQTALDAISIELTGSGKCLGYRAMWKRLQKAGICIPKHVVRHALTILDPDGVKRRKNRKFIKRDYVNPGPNFMWHSDSYDKLKPYGICINGAIDGYSRRILWLEVGPSNSDPRIIASYYLQTVRQLQCVPCMLRCDLGTENKHLEKLQPFFTERYDDPYSGEASFLYGKSTANQRIESWWSILRRQGADFWIAFFKDMQYVGLFQSHNPIHTQALRLCFMPLIRKDLNCIAIEWNQHLIETKKNAEGPRGKPDIMYFNPQLYDAYSYGKEINLGEVDVLLHDLQLQNIPPQDYDPEFLYLVSQLLPNFQEPRSPNEALELYVDILACVEDLDNRH